MGSGQFIVVISLLSFIQIVCVGGIMIKDVLKMLKRLNALFLVLGKLSDILVPYKVKSPETHPGLFGLFS